MPIAHKIGYRAVTINYRGLGNTRLLTPRLYCAANDDDVQHALRHIRATNPQAKLVATGVSLGGILLARYLIRSGHDALVDAAFLVSVCWDFMQGCESMEMGLNYALNQHLTRALIGIVLENKHLFGEHPLFDEEALTRSRDIRQFDEAFTCRFFGFESVRDYYLEATHKGKIACIKKPTFCINAADDMFAPYESEFTAVQLPGVLMMCLTKRSPFLSLFYHRSAAGGGGAEQSCGDAGDSERWSHWFPRGNAQSADAAQLLLLGARH